MRMTMARLQAVVFDGQSASPELQRRYRCGRRGADLDPAGRRRRSGAARLRRRLCARRSICVRSSICRRSASMATAAAIGSTRKRRRARLGARLRTACGRAGLAGFRRAPRHRRCHLAACRHLRAGPQRAHAGRARQRAPHRQARANLQPHSCRRHRAGDRRRVRLRRRPGFSTLPMTSRRRPAIRSSSRRSSSASRRRRKSPSPKPRRRCRLWR